MKKRIVITCIIVVFALTLILGGILLFNKKEVNNEVNNNQAVVASTIILDINPSIKINLDVYENVVSIIALNEGAAYVIPNNLVGKSLNDAITLVTDELIEKGYAKDGNISMLISTSGEIKANVVENLLVETFEEKEIIANIIIQDISDAASSVAEAYNISESKASYIESIIKDNASLTIDELKDKSITELEEIKNKKEDVKKETEKQPISTTDNQKSSSNNNSSTKNSSTKQPSDPTKDIDAWCRYNKNGNPYGHEKPMMLNENNIANKMETYVMEKYNISSTDEFITRGATISKEDNRSSYCVAYLVKFVTRDWYKTFYVDSVTGDIIDEVTKNVPTLLTELEARSKALEYYGLTTDDVWDYARGEARLTINGINGEEVYTYSVVLSLKNGESRYLRLNAITGNIID